MNQPLATEIHIFDPARVRIYFDEFHDLALDVDGETHRQLSVQRAFPLNAPDHFIVIKDRDGKEIGLIEDLNALDADARNALSEALDQTYFIPRITRILHIETHFHIPRLDVDTDHGPRSFEIPSTHRDMRVLENGRILLRDADGNRYEIPDYRKFDPESRAIVDALI